jgi:hypothetical protein
MIGSELISVVAGAVMRNKRKEHLRCEDIFYNSTVS